MNPQNRDQNSFFQFSDQLRLHTSNFSNLSISDSIWSNARSQPSDLVTNGWKTSFVAPQKLAFANTNPNSDNRYNINDSNVKNTIGTKFINNKLSNDFDDTKNYKNDHNKGNKGFNLLNEDGKYYNFEKGLKNNYDVAKDANSKKKNVSVRNNNSGCNSANEKKLKTLPAAEILPRNEAVGGYIFVCNNDTMDENLKRELFGLPPRYRDSVRAITPGLPLFLYNYSTHQLHGIFEAASFGGTNIDPTAWEDKKALGSSRFPSQVKVITRKICDPLEEDAFRPILHHYDGPKFRLELNIEEALKLLDIFAEKKV